jgi:hypothetical protein
VQRQGANWWCISTFFDLFLPKKLLEEEKKKTKTKMTKQSMDLPSYACCSQARTDKSDLKRLFAPRKAIRLHSLSVMGILHRFCKVLSKFAS